jgi:carotenoid cleavage oxygenase
MAERLGVPSVDGPTQPLYDISNTNVIGFAGRILPLTEGCYPYQLSGELETVCRVDFGAPLPHGLTAHPKLDPVTGELHAFAYW